MSLSGPTTAIRRWLREPVVLFLLIGAALFAADRLLNGPSTAGFDDATHIVIAASQQAAFREAYRAERGRDPSPAEMQERLDHWIEEEVLYREALALNLDRKDLIVHRQLTQKMRFLLEDATPLPAPTEDELQTWLDQHAERYGHSPTLSFQQVFLSRGAHGDDLQADAARLGAELSRTPDAFAALGDPFPMGQAINNVSAIQVRREFGPGFAEAIEQMPLGKWSGPVISGLGLHYVRPIAKSPFRVASLAEVRQRVLTDYQTAQHEQRSQKAIEQLKRKYRIDVEGVAG